MTGIWMRGALVPTLVAGFALYWLWSGRIRYMSFSIQRTERPILYWAVMLIAVILAVISFTALFNPYLKLQDVS